MPGIISVRNNKNHLNLISTYNASSKKIPACSFETQSTINQANNVLLQWTKGRLHERHLNFSDTWDNFASRITSSWTSFCMHLTDWMVLSWTFFY